MHKTHLENDDLCLTYADVQGRLYRCFKVYKLGDNTDMFEGLEIKTFKLSELNGKTIKVFATKNEEGLTVVMGYEKESGHCYVLAIEGLSNDS